MLNKKKAAKDLGINVAANYIVPECVIHELYNVILKIQSSPWNNRAYAADALEIMRREFPEVLR